MLIGASQMNRIAEIREKAQIKQGDLIAALGWTQSRVSNYEAGRRLPGLAESRAIVAALNSLGAKCTLDDVFPAPAELITERRAGDRRNGERREGDRRQGERRNQAA